MGLHCRAHGDARRAAGPSEQHDVSRALPVSRGQRAQGLDLAADALFAAEGLPPPELSQASRDVLQFRTLNSLAAQPDRSELDEVNDEVATVLGGADVSMSPR